MSYVIALLILILGCSEIYLIVRTFKKMKLEASPRTPKFVHLALLWSSLVGIGLIFVSFDIIFKWI